jgi:DNA invertase Pin-like site-specific DNA recombinase
VQLGALRRAGCELVYTDEVSAGKHQRPGLRQARSLLRKGDVLVVWRLDRLACSVKTLVHVMSELAEEGVHFRSVSEALDTMAPSGQFFFDMIFLLAQMERALIAEAEQTKARQDAEGKRPWAEGRKRRMTRGQIESAKQLLMGGMSASKVAENLDVPLSTLYRWVPASSLKKHT